jgi:hypothetical protein
MSEHEHELAQAAASGAAAAVAAVADEQQEEERANAVANAALTASESALEAGEEAEQASEAATTAAEVATEAHAQSEVAESKAEEAEEKATTAVMGVESLAEHVSAGFAELRQFITTALEPKQQDSEPTEVVVSHADSGQDSREGTNAGSGGSSPAATDDRPYRHKFGRRRT